LLLFAVGPGGIPSNCIDRSGGLGNRVSVGPLVAFDLNWSIQHLNSNCREKDVENETKTEDLLLRYTEDPDVGSVAESRFYARHSPSF